MTTFGSKCKLLAALAAAGAFVALSARPALAGPAAAAMPVPLTAPPCVPADGGLYGVTAASATSYWTVGNANNGTEVFNHNLTALTPAVPPLSYLRGVAATSATTAVAVGYTVTSGTANILIMTGTTTTDTPLTGLPTFPAGTSSYLYGVAVSSPVNAWAVGYTEAAGVYTPLILHGTGAGLATWTQVPIPATIPPDSYLCGVTTTSVSNGSFAVGSSVVSGSRQTLIMQGFGPSAAAVWGPTAAYAQPPAPDSSLYGVAAAPASATRVKAYAVGSTTTPSATKRGNPLIYCWNGTAWVPATGVPDPGTIASRLFGVTITPSTPGELPKATVWAVGFTRTGNVFQTLIVHQLVYQMPGPWTQPVSTNPAPNDALFGVTATSSTNAWAVGRQAPAASPYLAEHWNGTAW
jgi:hypothetical protein